MNSAPMAKSTAPTTANRTGAWRFEKPVFARRLAPCGQACPAGEDLARIELLAGRGSWAEAWELIRRENPFPGVCGRVCFRPCEASCNRGGYDEPISVRALERHAAERARKAGWKHGNDVQYSTGGRVAVVGAGPAGLTAAHFLTRLGHAVHVFDSRGEPGGALRYAIPEYRLPSADLAWEVGLVLAAGVEFHPNRCLGSDLGWDELLGYDAVFLAVGAWRPASLGVEGQELASSALALLEAVRQGERPALQGRVAVVGGGNTAMDAARVLARLGAEPTVYYRRRLADLPALAEEVEEAAEEGVRIEPLLAPERLEKGEGGALRLHLRPMAVSTQGEDGRYRVQASGEPLNAVDVTAVFVAVGGLPSAGLPSEAQPPHVRTVGTHLALIAPEGPFARRPVFVGGDLVNARRTVVTAIASGKEAALAIHAALQGQAPERALAAARATRDGPVSMALAACAESTGGRVIGPEDLNLAYFRHDSRRSGPRISASRRQTGFDEVRRDLSATAALGEARRCFHCGLCDQCDNCYRFCPDLSVLRDVLAGSREIDYDHCKGCGICAEECPRGVIELRPE